MSGDDGLAAHVAELMAQLGPVRVRKFFGGYGVYLDGLMFGLIFDGRLFLKADDETRQKFVAQGCERFVYDAKDKQIQVGYWTVPDEAMDAPDQMRPWGQLAIAAALRKANSKSPRRPKTAKTAKKSAATKRVVRRSRA
jgi:DNA transformation protein and related proteins